MNMRNVLGMVLSMVLVWGLMPIQALAVEPADANADAAQDDAWARGTWRDDIDAMLSRADYVEGEVLVTAADDEGAYASVRDTIGFDATCEGLFETSGSAFESALGTSISEEELAAVQKNGETVCASDIALMVYLVTDPATSTRDMLEALTKDSRVLDASPNYLYAANDGDDEGKDDAADGGEGEEQGGELDGGEGEEQGGELDGGEGEAPEAGEAAGEGRIAVQNGVAPLAVSSFVPDAAQDVTASADATSLQWPLNRSADASTFMGGVSPDAALDVAGWNTGAENAAGVVAVFDTGVDFDHPDLASSMLDMSPYQPQVGGTARGYNALSDASDPLDDNGHGTHVAGIIAAAANGFGVSGVANGVKLLPVKVADSGGRFKSSDIQRGYSYLKRAAQAGVDLRVVNNSWSGAFIDPSLNVAVTELGMLGVVSVFASGNNGVDIDDRGYTATGLKYSQYSVVVDSLDMGALASRFTNYGKQATDVFAPGGSIMSTTLSSAPGSYVASAMRSASPTTVTFDGASDTVSAASDRGKKLGAVDSSSGFDDEGGCLAISGKELAGLPRPSGTAATKRVVLNVPVDEDRLDEASMVGCAVNFTGRASTNAWLEVFDSRGSRLWNDAEKVVLDAGNWGTLSLDLHKACIDHNRSIAVYHDAVGQAYIKVAVCIDATRLEASTAGMKIDCVGVGSQSWHYGFMSGTSMAAPMVSGLAAVLANDIPSYTSLEVTARAYKAANLVIKSCRTSAELEDLCWSGGVVNPGAFAQAVRDDVTPYLGDVKFEDSADKTYTIETLLGIGFGEREGSVLVSALDSSGLEYEVISWTNTKIQLKIPLAKGSSTVKTTVTTAEGAESTGTVSGVLSGKEGEAGPGGAETPGEPDGPQQPEGSKTPGQLDGPRQPEGSGAPGAGGGAGGSGDAPRESAPASDAGVDGKASVLAATGDGAGTLLPASAVAACAAGGVAARMAFARRRR